MPQGRPLSATYSGFCFLAEWPEMVVALERLEARLRANDRPEAANLVLVAYGEFRDRMLLLGESMAKLGTVMLRTEEKDSRVRPDTQGQGGKRLENYLVVQPLAPTLLPGAIGINNEELLDNNVPWWVTNELGSSTQIGRKIFGLFYNPGEQGGEPPDSTFDRQHALFTPAPPESGAGGAVLQHGIPARHFVERAGPKIEKEWLAGAMAIKAEFMAKLDVALATMR